MQSKHDSEARSVFSDIYDRREWGDDVRSGVGSKPDQVAEYVPVLQRVLQDLDVRTVADLGCGDWSFSRHVDWSGVQYTGYDVVPSLIEAHRERYGADNIRFEARDLFREALPPADLAVCKDVLQHWPNAAVHRFLEKLSVYRWVLLTNDRDNYRRRFGLRWPLRRPANQDIPLGQWRAIRLREPPFQLEATPLGEFEATDGKEIWLKEILLVTNRGS